MKKYRSLAVGLVCLLTLSGCGTGGRPDTIGGDSIEGDVDGKGTEENTGQGIPQEKEEQQPDASPQGDGGEDRTEGTDKNQEIPAESNNQTFLYKLRIVDGAESGNLVLAGEGSGEVYTLALGTASAAGNRDGENSRLVISVFLDGQPADYTALEDGMMAEISYDGTIEETFPARLGGVESVSVYSLGTEKNPGGSLYDLCGLYLQVLGDLWDRDAGLNGGINWVSVDLTEAPGELTKGEKDAVAWIFGCEHEVDSLTLTYEELKGQGYLTQVDPSIDLYQWEDGVLFRITDSELGKGMMYSLPTVKFDAEKWRSPMGAYYLMDCIAVWPEFGTWSDYEIGGEAIS